MSDGDGYQLAMGIIGGRNAINRVSTPNDNNNTTPPTRIFYFRVSIANAINTYPTIPAYLYNSLIFIFFQRTFIPPPL
jgi:hypothetical protein